MISKPVPEADVCAAPGRIEEGYWWRRRSFEAAEEDGLRGEESRETPWLKTAAQLQSAVARAGLSEGRV